MRSRLGDAARDVAEGKITLEEVTRAILDAVRDHNLRLADQGAFYVLVKLSFKSSPLHT